MNHDELPDSVKEILAIGLMVILIIGAILISLNAHRKVASSCINQLSELQYTASDIKLVCGGF